MDKYCLGCRENWYGSVDRWNVWAISVKANQYFGRDQKLHITKKQLQLDKVIEILNSFHKNYAHYRANVRNYTVSSDGLSTSNFSEEAIDQQREKFRSAFDSFVDAESYVLSIGSIAVSETLKSSGY